MVTEHVRMGAGTPLCEGTRERKESEITEQALLQNQGGEGVQGQSSQKEPSVLRKADWPRQPRQPRQVGAGRAPCTLS